MPKGVWPCFLHFGQDLPVVVHHRNNSQVWLSLALIVVSWHRLIKGFFETIQNNQLSVNCKVWKATGHNQEEG